MKSPNRIDRLADGLLATLTRNVLPAFKAYVDACAVSRWLIASDFCIGTTHRNDTFVYTTIPGDRKLPHPETIARLLPHDLKHTKTIDEAVLTFLKRQEWFSFVFVPDKTRRLIRSHQEARVGLDESISMMQSWPNADTHLDLIRKTKAVRQKASSKGFNLKLFNDVVLASALGAVVGTFISRCTDVSAIGWAPDRDAITEKWGGIANLFFVANLHAFCVQHGIRESPQPAYFGPTPGQPADEGLWYDPFVRIADYVAGAIAACDLTGARTRGRTPKHHEIVFNVLADNPNVAVVRLGFSTEQWSGSIVKLSRSPQQG